MATVLSRLVISSSSSRGEEEIKSEREVQGRREVRREGEAACKARGEEAGWQEAASARGQACEACAQASSVTLAEVRREARSRARLGARRGAFARGGRRRRADRRQLVGTPQ